MTQSLLNFFYNNNVYDLNDIVYITKVKSSQIAQFHLADGRVITKYISLKKCRNELPSDIFISINKGILININHVKYVNRYIYYMKNGMVFEGRLKDSQLHKRIKEIVRARAGS